MGNADDIRSGTPLIPAAPPRSSFVSVLAWVFIALSAFTTLIGVMQNVMLHLMLRGEMGAAMRSAPEPAGMPGAASFLMRHVDWLFAGFLMVSTLTLAAAIGLLRRHEWARRVFIALLGLGIAWQLAGLVMQFLMMPAFLAPLAQAPDGFAKDFRAMTVAILAFSAIMALGFCVLFGWLIKRLMSTAVRAEFASTDPR
ncbi:hypothetical protein [Dokdonella soli]